VGPVVCVRVSGLLLRLCSQPALLRILVPRHQAQRLVVVVTGSAPRHRGLLVAAVTVALAVALFFFFAGGDQGLANGYAESSTAAASQLVSPQAAAVDRDVPRVRAKGERPASPIAKGLDVVSGAWGGAPGEFGRRADPESAPEAPMSLAVGPNGDLFVLDQVNARIQRFDANGGLVGQLDTGSDTVQDLAIDADGRVAALDRLGDSEVVMFDENGRQVDRIGVEGGPIDDPGAVSGIFTDSSGTYLERDNTEIVRIADGNGTRDDERPTDPGRRTRDGKYFLSAQILDATAGVALVRVFDSDAQVVWQTRVSFDKQILHLALLDSDRTGYVHVGALTAHMQEVDPFDSYDATMNVVRLAQADGSVRGSLALPAPDVADEMFRPLVVTDQGDIVQMLPSENGFRVVRYSYPP